eukprot:6802466-Prymnesium_polylepis.2
MAAATAAVMAVEERVVVVRAAEMVGAMRGCAARGCAARGCAARGCAVRGCAACGRAACGDGDRTTKSGGFVSPVCALCTTRNSLAPHHHPR